MVRVVFSAEVAFSRAVVDASSSLSWRRMLQLFERVLLSFLQMIFVISEEFFRVIGLLVQCPRRSGPREGEALARGAC